MIIDSQVPTQSFTHGIPSGGTLNLVSKLGALEKAAGMIMVPFFCGGKQHMKVAVSIASIAEELQSCDGKFHRVLLHGSV